jgi:hypothetical protein
VALLCLLDEETPQLLQISKPLSDGLSIETTAIGDNVLAPLKDVINARLVPLDFFLESLCENRKHTKLC